jgi:hypothetical protein
VKATFTAETQRTLRPRRDSGFSLRNLGALGVSAVKGLLPSDQLIFLLNFCKMRGERAKFELSR